MRNVYKTLTIFGGCKQVLKLPLSKPRARKKVYQYMKVPLPIAALTAILTCSLFLGGLAQNFEEATWTLDETPTQKPANP